MKTKNVCVGLQEVSFSLSPCCFLLLHLTCASRSVATCAVQRILWVVGCNFDHRSWCTLVLIAHGYRQRPWEPSSLSLESSHTTLKATVSKHECVATARVLMSVERTGNVLQCVHSYLRRTCKAKDFKRITLMFRDHYHFISWTRHARIVGQMVCVCVCVCVCGRSIEVVLLTISNSTHKAKG